MAQKAAKNIAKRNSQALNRMHAYGVSVHAFYIVLRMILFRSSFHRSSLLLYILLSLPAGFIELVFERNSRPKWQNESQTDLKTSGADLDSSGLTEWMWDILYWTWGCTVGAAILGDWAWSFYIAIPLYSGWLAYRTFAGFRSGQTGGDFSLNNTAPTSKRQQKLEKRGTQRQKAY